MEEEERDGKSDLLCVNTPLIERLHLEGIDGVIDKSSAIGSVVVIEYAILRKHLCHKPSLCNDLKLHRTRMNVRSVEPARPEKSNGHASASPHERRERLAVCCDEIATFAPFPFKAGSLKSKTKSPSEGRRAK